MQAPLLVSSSVLTLRRVRFDPWVVSASMLIAIIASAAAFLLLFVIQMPMLQIVSAAVMGIAVCGAHYT